MNWLSVDSYIAQFGSEEAIALTDRANSGAPNEALIRAAITTAQSLAISYLGDRAAAVNALSQPPAVLVNVLADLSRHQLYDAGAPEEVTARRATAISWLRDVAAGRAALPLTSAPGSGQPMAVADKRQFGARL